MVRGISGGAVVISKLAGDATSLLPITVSTAAALRGMSGQSCTRIVTNIADACRELASVSPSHPVQIIPVKLARMTNSKYIACRNSYAYPAVGLRTLTEGRRFSSVTAMEHHFQRLFRSNEPLRVQLAYLSVIYWGHYLGRSGKPNPNRAYSKVELAMQGLHAKGLEPAQVASLIRAAQSLLRRGRPAPAMILLMQLPQLGFAFASKICAFLDSQLYGVIDGVIARKYPRLQFHRTKDGYVSNALCNHAAYRRYCQFLTRTAARLNALGISYRWRERSGSRRRWRAVDVERALYSS